MDLGFWLLTYFYALDVVRATLINSYTVITIFQVKHLSILLQSV